MNKEKLKEAEKRFLQTYPGGFDHPEMVVLSKKHKPQKMKDLTRESFSPEAFKDPETVVESMVRVITRSSMVSVFEKPKFRDYAKMISADEKALLAKGLYEILYGDQKSGFEMMLEILAMGKLAKWTLMTIIPVYFRPHDEVYVKPTTARGVIKFFEVEGMRYNARPTWDFYVKYRNLISEMKKEVSENLRPDNAAFTGFLMMSIDSFS